MKTIKEFCINLIYCGALANCIWACSPKSWGFTPFWVGFGFAFLLLMFWTWRDDAG